MRDIVIFSACATAIVLATYAIWAAGRAEYWAKVALEEAEEARQAASIARQIRSVVNAHMQRVVDAEDGCDGYEAPT